MPTIAGLEDILIITRSISSLAYGDNCLDIHTDPFKSTSIILSNSSSLIL